MRGHLVFHLQRVRVQPALGDLLRLYPRKPGQFLRVEAFDARGFGAIGDLQREKAVSQRAQAGSDLGLLLDADRGQRAIQRQRRHAAHFDSLAGVQEKHQRGDDDQQSPGAVRRIQPPGGVVGLRAHRAPPKESSAGWACAASRRPSPGNSAIDDPASRGAAGSPAW
ncbi:hypothetical protein D3C71_1404270 [compost metagenome]